MRGLVHILQNQIQIHYQQNHAARTIFNEDILNHSRPLLRSLSALNIYQINLYQHANFVYIFE